MMSLPLYLDNLRSSLEISIDFNNWGVMTSFVLMLRPALELFKETFGCLSYLHLMEMGEVCSSNEGSGISFDER